MPPGAGAHVRREDGWHRVQLTVEPVGMPRETDGVLLVSFVDEPQVASPPALPGAPAEREEPGDRQLEDELRATREDLQGTIGELESSNQELKVANEEIMSVNEELRSSNEELETSKEVQSRDGRWYIRQVLPYRTHDDRIDGVVITFSDVAAEALQEARLYAEAIVDTIREPLLVLDSELRVQSANRSFYETFGLTPD